MFISGVKQSESVIHIHICICIYIFQFFSHLGLYRVLNRVSCTICVLSCSAVSNSLWPHGLWPARLLCPWDFPGKNGAVDCHFLFQGIFLTQGLNPHLLHWQRDALPLSQQGSPVLYSRWLLVIYFTYTSMYVSIPLSQIIFRSLLSPLVTGSLFSTSVTLFLFHKSVHLYPFLRSHI